MHDVFKSVNVHFLDSKIRCLYNFCQLFISLSSFVSSFGQKVFFQRLYFFCNKYSSFHLVVLILVTTFSNIFTQTLALAQIFRFQKWKYNSPYFTEEIFVYSVQETTYFVILRTSSTLWCLALMKSISFITCFFSSLLFVWHTKSYCYSCDVITDVINSVFLTQIISRRPKKCWHESCITDFTSAKMEFASVIFKNYIFINMQLKGVVNRLPRIKNLSDHTNR